MIPFPSFLVDISKISFMAVCIQTNTNFKQEEVICIFQREAGEFFNFVDAVQKRLPVQMQKPGSFGEIFAIQITLQRFQKGGPGCSIVLQKRSNDIFDVFVNGRVRCQK